MLVESCINYIIIGIILCSIPVLIYSIKNKDKMICKNLLILDITYIVYLFIITAILPSILGLDQGLEVLFIYLLSFVAGIIYIVSVIICKKKMKKINDTYTKLNKIIIITIVLILLPILLFLYSFFRECYLIKNSDLIIETNYQNGIIISNDYRYAISEDYCEEVTINVPKGENYKEIEYYTYYVDFINNSDNYEIEELVYLDKTKVKKILLDAKNNHNNLENYYHPGFDKDEVIINRAVIIYFKDTDYYFVEIGYDYNGDGGMAVINSMIYKGENFIGELRLDGGIEAAKVHN